MSNLLYTSIYITFFNYRFKNTLAGVFKYLIIFTVFFPNLTSHAGGAPVKSNTLFVEDLQCNMSTMIGGNLHNESERPFKGVFIVKVIDEHKKLLWQTSEKVVIKEHNALKFGINTHSIGCGSPNSIKVVFG